MKRSISALVATLALAALIPAVAGAHAALKSTSPGNGKTVTSLKRITVTFAEAIPTGTITAKRGGKTVPLTVKVKGAKIIATLKGAAKAGTYKVHWHAVADDGHKEDGMFSFKVSA